MPPSIALDLGTSRIKGACLDEAGHLTRIVCRDAPPLVGEDLIRESDAQAYISIAHTVLAEIGKGLPEGTPLGMAAQRSSFLLWDRETGTPVTPLISWQDRRAMDWCDRHGVLKTTVKRLTGLLLSPHYVGPKLACIMECDPALRARAEDGALFFGTIETFLLWSWSRGAVHQTDVTMAGRTLLADVHAGGWSVQLLDAFGVPARILPEIALTVDQHVALPGGPCVMSTVADQPAGVLSAIGEDQGSALVNLGTGGFVLRPMGSHFAYREGYLSGPLLARSDRETVYAVEGTINGVGHAAARFGRGPTPLPENDPAPQAYALPDDAGLGAPYWRPERTLTFSERAKALDGEGKRRIVLEGIVFRVRGILEDLCAASDRIYLSGGLAGDPFVGQAMASCLASPIEQLEESESTLRGAARLAAGLDPCDAPPSVRVEPGRPGEYLNRKYDGWKSWVTDLLG